MRRLIGRASLLNALLLSSACLAQLRVVQYNAGAVKPGLSTILQQIGNENVNGIARPIDVLAVEEQQSAAYVSNLVATLNSIYGPGTYVGAPYVGITSGGGLPALVYRPSSVSLIGTPIGIGTVSSTTNARQTIKYVLRPNGYDSSADLYVYAMHLKSSTGSSNAARRNAEVITDRADADAMGPGKNVLYMGDFNLYSGSEPAFQTLTAPGNEQANDPASAPLNWSGSANRIYHTQSPATIAAYGGQVTGGMDDRFDFQLVSSGLFDGQGLAYIAGSYRAFGNNGTHPLKGAINNSANTWSNPGLTVPASTVLNALTTASDHIPVVVDYQLPARMAVNVAAVPGQVIVGANLPVNVTVSNVAPVTVPAGADVLNYSLSTSGAATGSAAGVATATLAGRNHSISLNTSSTGARSGTVTVTSSSQAVANGSFSQQISTTVLAHAIPSFAAAVASLSNSLDFGVWAKGSPPPSMPFLVANLADPSGFTAALDVDSIGGSGNTARLATNLQPFKNLSAGNSRSFLATLDSSSTGTFDASYLLGTSDQDLPGATNRAFLSLRLHGVVAIGGDANLDGRVDIRDLADLSRHFQSTGTWQQGDFNRDGLVDKSDLTMITKNWLAGTTGPLGDPVPADGSATSVPEPAIPMLAALGVTALLTAERRKAKRN